LRLNVHTGWPENRSAVSRYEIRVRARTHTHSVLTTDTCLILEDYKPETSESCKKFLSVLRSLYYEWSIWKHCY